MPYITRFAEVMKADLSAVRGSATTINKTSSKIRQDPDCKIYQADVLNVLRTVDAIDKQTSFWPSSTQPATTPCPCSSSSWPIARRPLRRLLSVHPPPVHINESTHPFSTHHPLSVHPNVQRLRCHCTDARIPRQPHGHPTRPSPSADRM